jgi:hypothetical protein
LRETPLSTAYYDWYWTSLFSKKFTIIALRPKWYFRQTESKILLKEQQLHFCGVSTFFNFAHPIMFRILLLSLSLAASAASAQIELVKEVVSAAGNEVSKDNFALQYSVGEICVSIVNEENFEFTAGFNVLPGLTITAVSHENSARINIFPNPTANVLTVECNVKCKSLQLLSINGTPVLTMERCDDRNISIDLSGLTAGSYILRLDSHSYLIEKK